MAAFQFPDPAVTQTVKNPITGSTYQWQDPPGKWVVTVSIREFGDIIWEGELPPDPIGDYKLWYSTDTLELYFYFCDINDVCAWVPTSAPITMLEDLDAKVFDIDVLLQQVNVAASTNENEIQLIKDGLGQVDLEEVLTNGNIADKDIVLTDGVDDLIDISPTEGRIIIASDADVKTPKITLAHFGDHEDGNRKADIELDENGTRLDFEMSESVKDVHFRFGDDEKFIINHEGDAEFTGKVKVQPGTEGNEAATYSQVASLENEIEGMRPSFDRGVYDFTNKLVDFSGSGDAHYAIVDRFVTPQQMCDQLYTDCQKAAGGDTVAQSQCLRDYDACIEEIEGEDGDAPIFKDQWNGGWLWIDLWDKNDTLHTFRDAKVDTYIELTNSDGTGFMLAQIEEDRKEVEPGLSQIKIKAITWRGAPSGEARIKVFDMSEGDPTNYVKKSGDTMTGKLETTDKIWIRPEGQGANGANNMLVVNQQDASGGSIARFQKNSSDIVKVEFDETLSLCGNRIKNVANPQENLDATNKQWVEEHTIAAEQSGIKITFKDGVYFIQGA